MADIALHNDQREVPRSGVVDRSRPEDASLERDVGRSKRHALDPNSSRNESHVDRLLAIYERLSRDLRVQIEHDARWPQLKCTGRWIRCKGERALNEAGSRTGRGEHTGARTAIDDPS